MSMISRSKLAVAVIVASVTLTACGGTARMQSTTGYRQAANNACRTASAAGSALAAEAQVQGLNLAQIAQDSKSIESRLLKTIRKLKPPTGLVGPNSRWVTDWAAQVSNGPSKITGNASQVAAQARKLARKVTADEKVLGLSVCVKITANPHRYNT